MREKNLEGCIKQIKKQFGDESIMLLGKENPKKIQAISTGSMLIDSALGIDGYPVGRIVEVFGPESSGKTTLSLHAVAEVQKDNKVAAFIDAENAIDIEYAKSLGVDTKNLLLSQPDSGEQALEIVHMLIKSNAVDLIVIDSVAALVPQVELDGEMNDQTIGAQARMMSKALRKMAADINQNNVTVIFINQLREKVGVIYGNPEVTTGGRALKFYASIRLEIRKSDFIKNGAEIIGIKSRVKIIKNKVAPPFKTVEIDILYGLGISKTSELIELAAGQDIITKAGSWYSYNNVKIGQGRDSVKIYLKNNPKIEKEIEKLYLEKKKADKIVNQN